MSIYEFLNERNIEMEVCTAPVVECGEKVIIDKKTLENIIETADHYTNSFKKVAGDLYELKLRKSSFDEFHKSFNEIVNYVEKALFGFNE